jgi:thiol:disulfide interchange protein DsbA
MLTMLKQLICLLLLLPSLVFAAPFTEGKDYQVITNPRPLTDRTKGPVLTEFFSYGCPWCYKMEEPLQGWISHLKSPIELERVPVVFKSDWEIYAKAYYTAKTLALSDKLNPLLFKAIQVDKQPLSNKEAMIRFFVTQGVDKEIAKSAFNHSPSIDMRVSNDMSLLANYQINAVPAFVVNNRYKTDLQMAGSTERLFELLDYLMTKPA